MDAASGDDVADGAPLPEQEGCGLRAGESLMFEFWLPYEAAELLTEPIYVSLSDGRTGIASR
jgi:hypothetical protein